MKKIGFVWILMFVVFLAGCSEETKTNLKDNVDRIKEAVSGNGEVETAFEKTEDEKKFVLSFVERVLHDPMKGSGLSLMRPQSFDLEGNDTRYSYFEYMKKNLKGCAVKKGVNPEITDTYVPTIEGARGYLVLIQNQKNSCPDYFAVEVSTINNQLWVDTFLANDPTKPEWLGW